MQQEQANSQPKQRHFVSVIISTYNRVESLAETIKALEAQQVGGVNHEWIIVDNNSTDSTSRFLAEYAARQDGSAMPRLKQLRETRPLI